MNTSTRDAGIPILTEVIGEAPAEDVAPVTVAPAAPATPSYPAAPPPVRPALKSPILDPVAAKAAAGLSSDEWNQLEREIRERILRQIVERIEALLDQRIRDSVASVMQVAIQGLTADIKTSLRHSIDDVVTRAVSQEIAQFKSLKK